MQTVSMGQEGMPWVGAQTFVDTPHMFQNLGDGTYTHSGLLTIRASVAAKSRVTFKILYNDAVAMTGGQPAEGALTPEQIVQTALQEDADAVGLSVLSGAHMTLFAQVMKLLAERGGDDIVVFGGGIIPDADIAELSQMGVAAIFTPGAPTTDIVDWVRARFPG